MYTATCESSCFIPLALWFGPLIVLFTRGTPILWGRKKNQDGPGKCVARTQGCFLNTWGSAENTKTLSKGVCTSQF